MTPDIELKLRASVGLTRGGSRRQLVSSQRPSEPRSLSRADEARIRTPLQQQPAFTALAKSILIIWLVHILKIADSTTVVVQPSTAKATLVYGQALHFECMQIGKKNAQFIWLKRNVFNLAADATDQTGRGEPQETLLEPNTDDTIEIHNERLTLLKPNYNSIGDYVCRALNDDKTVNYAEYEIIQLRAPPSVDDFGVETSHTGESTSISDGERLELTCRVRDQSVPVNITWVISEKPDSDYIMIKVPEFDFGHMPVNSPNQQLGSDSQNQALITPTYTVPNNVWVERIDAFSKKLIISQAGLEHRGYYKCFADNGVNRTRKTIYVRVKDKIIALWPFLGILAELFILFTIIYVWETQKAQKNLLATTSSSSKGTNSSLASTAIASRSLVPASFASGGPTSGGNKRPASGPSNEQESLPLASEIALD